MVGGDVRRYHEHLQSLGLQVTTINRRLLGVRAWFGVLKLSLDLPHNPATGVGLMEETPLGPPWLDPAERLALQREMERHWLAAQARPDSVQAIWQIRDAALLSVLYHTGLRVTEVAHLDLPHLELNANSGWLTVHGKGRKQRRVPLNAEARARLTDWLARRPACDSPAVFVSTQRRRMVTRSIERAVGRLRRARWHSSHDPAPLAAHLCQAPSGWRGHNQRRGYLARPHQPEHPPHLHHPR